MNEAHKKLVSPTTLTSISLALAFAFAFALRNCGGNLSEDDEGEVDEGTIDERPNARQDLTGQRNQSRHTSSKHQQEPYCRT